mgnify:CR=1 FL=1
MRRGRLRPAALLAVGLVLSSCTDEADRAAGTSTTVTAGPTTTTAPRIDAVAPELVEQLDAAEGDVCEIVKVQDRIRSAGVDETPESVSSVVLVMFGLVAASTMAQSVRERTAELAVLKTLGFTGPAILVLVLAESLFIACLGGGLGLAVAWAIASQGDPTGGLLAIFTLPTRDVWLGVGLMVLMGLGAPENQSKPQYLRPGDVHPHSSAQHSPNSPDS